MINFQNLTLKNSKKINCYYLENLKIINFIRKLIFFNLKNYKLCRKLFMSNEKINSKIKLSNNSSFAILIIVILKFRNIGRSTFEHSKFCTPPYIYNRSGRLWIIAMIIDNAPWTVRSTHVRYKLLSKISEPTEILNCKAQLCRGETKIFTDSLFVSF